MPELPEVETIRMALEPRLVDRRFQRVDQRRPDLRFPFPEHFVMRLEGRRVTRVSRRAKYLLVGLDSDDVLLIHLGMSGRIVVSDPGPNHAGPNDAGETAGSDAPGSARHDHVVFDLDDGTRIVFSDPRRFGFMDLFPAHVEETNRHLVQLGPEPLGNSFSSDYLDGALSGRRTPIKAALLDQRIVAGLGNIYVCEALYRASISPRRQAATIPGLRARRLVPAIRDVLNDAIAAGGSSLRDYVQADGSLGYFQYGFAVYDREGADCGKSGCSGTVRRIVQSGRSTFYCDRCQR